MLFLFVGFIALVIVTVFALFCVFEHARKSTLKMKERKLQQEFMREVNRP